MPALELLLGGSGGKYSIAILLVMGNSAQSYREPFSGRSGYRPIPRVKVVYDDTYQHRLGECRPIVPPLTQA